MRFRGTGNRKRDIDGDGGPGASDERGSGLRSTPAQDTLDQIAAALSVTTALLNTSEDVAQVQAGVTVSMLEASALMHAYVRIDDPVARQRCLEFVRDQASRQPNEIRR